MPLESAVLKGSPRLDSISAGGPSMKKEVRETDLEAVKKIQRAMATLTGPMPRSFPASLGGEPDGVYGSETAERVTWFQKYAFPSDWREWDGRVGKNTITAMDALLPKGVAPTPPAPPVPPAPVPPGPVPPSVGPIEKCKQNSKITLDGTNAVNLTPSKPPADWVTETQQVFDTICSVTLGKSLIDMIKVETIIKPFIPTAKDPLNAYSNGRRYIVAGAFVIEFTPHIWKSQEMLPGARADEVLLHEFIHMLEDNYDGYKDARDRSLVFDKADFLTVNGTNVYSSMVTRGLRKDHSFFSPLLARYKDNPTEHLVVFRENYDAAFENNSDLVRLFMKQPATWNPFKTFQPKNYLETYFIEIKPDFRWKWVYEFNRDKTARWTDPSNAGQFGAGRWKEEANMIIIDWNGGSWDKFPRIDRPGQYVSGTNKTAGKEYDSVVKRK